MAKSLFQQIWSNRENMLPSQAELGSNRGQWGQRELWVIMYVGTWVINLVCVCVKGEFVLIMISVTLTLLYCIICICLFYIYQIADTYTSR